MLFGGSGCSGECGNGIPVRCILQNMLDKQCDGSSDDMVHWENHRLPDGLPFYDYAPDVRVLGDWVYFCASNREHNCDRWRTKDILNGPYERIAGSFPFWDPNLFADDDGRIYFYWGCSNITPIYGVELDSRSASGRRRSTTSPRWR